MSNDFGARPSYQREFGAPPRELVTSAKLGLVQNGCKRPINPQALKTLMHLVTK